MSNYKPVGYAVIGLGGFAQRAVLPGFRNNPKARLVALVSGDMAKAKRLAKKFGAGACYAYEHLAACLTNPEVEAVYIATNNGSHAHYAAKAAYAGRHVLCEKPMATSVEECRQMLAACRTGGVRLMIAYRKYFEPGSLYLKKLITSGQLGRLKYIHSAFGIFMRVRKEGSAWHFDPKLGGGGALPDVGIYCINTIRWLLGTEPLQVSAHQWVTDPETFSLVDENIAFRMDFPDGVVAQAAASFNTAEFSCLEVQGEKGWAVFNPAYEYDEERRLFGKIEGRWFEKKFKIINELALEIGAFADSIRRNREPEPNGVQGMRDVAVMEAIYQSAREGRTVPLTLPE